MVITTYSYGFLLWCQCFSFINIPRLIVCDYNYLYNSVLSFVNKALRFSNTSTHTEAKSVVSPRPNFNIAKPILTLYNERIQKRRIQK